MRVETERAEIAAALQRTAAKIRAEDGFVAADFTVRESGGHISAAIGERFGEPGRILVSYPQQLTVPMHVLEWVDRPDAMELADPDAARAALTPPQWRLLVDWLVLINAVDRMSHVRASMPRFALADPSLRHHLANAGYPAMRKPPTDAGVRETAIAWHSMGAGQGPDGDQRWRLIPLKHLVNHHPTGADQNPDPGRTAVATSTTSDATETCENYGDLDALQLLMGFGYVDGATRLVHSVPVEVESAALGRVVVRWRAPRNPRAEAARDIPTLSRLGTEPRGENHVADTAGPDSSASGQHGEPTSSHLVTPGEPTKQRPAPKGRSHGIEVRHLTFRWENRTRVAAYLAMACQSLAAMTADDARSEAEAILDAILAANQAYYRRLDELVVASAEPFLPLAEVSLIQQQRLVELWG
jgi:hypothetical protein